MASYPYRAVATLKYRPPPTQGPSISFDKGSTVTVLTAADDEGDWLEGENDQGVKGVFPATFVERIEEEEDQGGEEPSHAKEIEQDTVAPPVETEHQKEDVPAPVDIQKAAESVSSVTTSPPPPTSPPTTADPAPAPQSSAPRTPAKATPPPPAKKPNALAARIAAFNQSQQSPAAPSAPVPRPKPASKWTVGSTSATSPPPAELSSLPPPSTETHSASQGSEQVETDSSGKPKEFSAEDAKESIGRGGGSLRDRIKALQGLQMDQPAPPGRAPKPWKKKVVEQEDEEDSTPSAQQGEADQTEKREEEAVVKDQEPKHDVELETERVPDIPSFEPAESAEPVSQPKNTAEEESASRENVSESLNEERSTSPSSPRPTASEKPSSIDLLAIAADSTPVVMTPGSASLEVPSDPSPFIPSTDKSPVSPQKEEEAVEGEEDFEAAKKAAITARMAGLGGQKIGAVPIPALPKKAAGPRRNPRGGAKAPAAEKPVEEPTSELKNVEIEQAGVGEKSEKTEQAPEENSTLGQHGSKEVESEVVTPEAQEESKKGDVFASMGGASSLLRADDDDEDEKNQTRAAFDDEDDFDSPAPPAPSRPAAAARPPPPNRPSEPKITFSDPELKDDEEQVGEEEFSQREIPREETDATVGAQAIDTLPIPETAEPAIESKTESDHEDAKPQAPLNRPPLPPAFVRQVTDEPLRKEIDTHRFTAEIDNPREGSASSGPPPPARPTKAPPIASGHETITDEPRPTAHGPDEVSPTPPDSQRQSPIVVPADLAGFEIPKDQESQRPPVPRHPAPPGHEKVTTDAEDRIMNESEVVTPPQEAFDESTAAPELTAPSVLDLAEVRDSHPESTDLSQQALPSAGRKEGELSPPPVASPRPTSPQQRRAAEEQDEDGDGEEEEEEEEEEDAEVARRRAIAARMAKLGGMSMRMGPMIPPMGGVAPTKKKSVRKPKPEEEEQASGLVEAKDLNEQVVESQSSGNVTPDHPARRYGGIPSGGFALPGIAALRPIKPEEPKETVESSERLPDEPVQERPSSVDAVESEDQEVQEELQVSRELEDEEPEEEPAPPPLPAGRPLSMPPPRRSVPVPVPEPETAQEEEEANQYEEPVPEHTEQFVEEPIQHVEAPAPPPPTRSIPAPSKRESTYSLGRSTTRSSRRSSTAPANAALMGFASPKQSLDLTFDAERVQGGGFPQGQFLAKDLDLDTQTGSAWWRTQGGLPRSLQGRNDVALELITNEPGNKELEVVYQDYSRTIISTAFDPEGTTEATTSISQNHFAPPPKPSLDILNQYSASLGAQMFAAAHLKANDKSARGMTDKQFVDFCFSRVTDPLRPIGTTFGAKVYEASSEGKKGPAFAMDCEPRAGDVVVFHEVKLKQTLGSKTIGSHVAIVSGFDEKKVKLRVLEVDKNGSSVDEGSYKLDDLKQGTITIYRVLGRDFLQ
ncbi:hypothetical protein JCM16303_001316 [Sporobolomyces ruberrimus]